MKKIEKFDLTKDEEAALKKTHQISEDIVDNHDPEEFNNCFCRGEGDAYDIAVDIFLAIYERELAKIILKNFVKTLDKQKCI